MAFIEVGNVKNKEKSLMDEEPRLRYHYYYHTNDPDAVLAYPHYSDPSFDGHGATIYGTDEPGLQWEYDDRLREWEPVKHAAIIATLAATYGATRNARRIESYLKAYFDQPTITLVCIKAGTQRFDGNPWYAFGFREEGGDNNVRP